MPLPLASEDQQIVTNTLLAQILAALEAQRIQTAALLAATEELAARMASAERHISRLPRA